MFGKRAKFHAFFSLVFKLISHNFRPLDTMIDDTETEVVPHILSEQEIMHKYWRISMNVRLASVALQRWMSSIIGLITTWSAIRYGC